MRSAYGPHPPMPIPDKNGPRARACFGAFFLYLTRIVGMLPLYKTNVFRKRAFSIERPSLSLTSQSKFQFVQLMWPPRTFGISLFLAVVRRVVADLRLVTPAHDAPVDHVDEHGIARGVGELVLRERH